MSMRLDFIVKLLCQTSTATLSLDVKYSQYAQNI